MDCENEPCPICAGPKQIGKVLPCLHTVCDECYILRVGEVGCVLCKKQAEQKKPPHMR